MHEPPVVLPWCLLLNDCVHIVTPARRACEVRPA